MAVWFALLLQAFNHTLIMWISKKGEAWCLPEGASLSHMLH